MALTGDRYVGEYEGHTIELVRDNWVKMLTLLIDGKKAASESIVLPHNVTLNGTFEHDGQEHHVTAKSLIDRMIFTKDSIEVDGVELQLTKSM